jgi:hypothetical protein
LQQQVPVHSDYRKERWQAAGRQRPATVLTLLPSQPAALMRAHVPTWAPAVAMLGMPCARPPCTQQTARTPGNAAGAWAPLAAHLHKVVNDLQRQQLVVC